MQDARPAASVLLARDGADGPEMFVVRRPAAAAAFADAWVFPGGTVRADDAGPLERLDALAELTRRGSTPPPNAGDAAMLWRCALRELFEEAGVLLVRGPLPPEKELRRQRERVHAGAASFDAALAELGLIADPGALLYFSHWITPRGLPRRFDTRFFVAALPPGQGASHCGIETHDGRWLAPRDALALHAAGELPLVLPTRAHLERVATCPSVGELLAFAAAKVVRTVQPEGPGATVEGEW